MAVRALVSALVIVLIMGLAASPALAQSQIPGVCDGPGSIQGDIGLTPISGPAGSAVQVDGALQLFPELTQQSEAGVQVWWLETGFGDAQLLDVLPLLIDENLLATFGGGIMVPAGAAPGVHTVALLPDFATDPTCLEFTVTQADVQPPQQPQQPQPAAQVTPAPATRLPATGFGFLPIAAGFAVSGMMTGIALRNRVTRRGKKS